MTALAVVAAALGIGPAAAFWSGSSAAAGRGAAAATTVNAGATPTGTPSGSTVTVSWVATTMASGQPVSGYEVSRYDAVTLSEQTVLGGCATRVTTTTCTETGVPDGTWRYSVSPVVGTSWRGAESARSVSVLVDTTGPASDLSLSSVTGAAVLSGSTVYYRGSAAGSLRLTNSVSDAASGPASSQTSPLSGVTTGWTHTGSTVTSPAGGPYVSNAFTWGSGTTSSPTVTITAKDTRGNSSTRSLTFVNDTDAPTGTISYADGYSSGRSSAIAYSTSGGAATAQLQRARASLRDGTCGAFGVFTNIGPTNPGSPFVDGPGLAGACYKYRLMASDALGNASTITSSSIVKLGYAGAVQATPGLVSYWRLGENADVGSDSFTGTSGVALQDRTGENGATWTRHPTATADAVLTPAGRARKEGSSAAALFQASGQPLSADYRVEASVSSQSVVAADRACVVGRLDPTVATYYAACFERATAAWTLSSVVGGIRTQLGSWTQSFPDGASRRLALDLAGPAVRLLVDGVEVITVASISITAAGRSGILMGPVTGTSTITDSTGLHLDDFRIGPVDAVPTAADARGSNGGSYVNGPVLGQAGALGGDRDTAVRFDGLDDYVQVSSPTGLPAAGAVRSVELWFKTTGTTRGVLFGYGSQAAGQEFALWLDPGATSMTAWGFGASQDKTFTLAAAVNDGQWHQVALTYGGTSLTLYVDGASVGTQTATRSTTIDAFGFGIGAIIAPGDINSGGYFDGWLDEVSVYDVVLPADTVADHHGLAAPVDDVEGPTGGSVDGTNLVGTGTRYRSSTSLTLGLAKGTDPSGVTTTGAQLLRAVATISSGTCAAFGAYTLVATDPPASYTHTLPTDNRCYRYRYVVADTLGNATTYASPTIKLDTTAPGAPGNITYTAMTNTYAANSTTTVYYRSSAGAGAITMTTTGSDTGSGIATYAWPVLEAGWGSSGSTSAANTYSWSSAAPTAPESKSITVTNNAALTSPGKTVTFVADDTAPSGGSIAYASGKTTAGSVTLTLAAGSDLGAGINTRRVQRADAPWSGTSGCGAFNSFVDVINTTATSYNASLPTADRCYRFQLTVTDRVGNATTYPSASVVRYVPYSSKVTGTAGVLDYWRLGETTGAAAIDTQGANNNGTYVGVPAIGVAGAIVGDTSTAATFDGSSQFVSALRGVTGTSFSLELWFRSTQADGGPGANWSNAAPLLDADVAGLANDFGIGLDSTGRVVAGVGTAGGSDSSIRSQSGLNDGSWHHVVFTRTQTGGALVLYVDGVQVASGTGGTATLTASATLRLAAGAGGSRFYAGSLDEVATYNAVLSAATVAAHYYAGT